MYVCYFASESHRQRCIADGAIKETDWTTALAKSARRQSDWSCSRLALHILRGARCREHSADPESRSRSDATSAQPSRCRRHHPLTRESRRGVAQARERERSRALSGSANPSSHPPSKEVLIGLYLDDSFYHRFEHTVTPRTQEEDQCRGYFKVEWWTEVQYWTNVDYILH